MSPTKYLLERYKWHFEIAYLEIPDWLDEPTKQAAIEQAHRRAMQQAEDDLEYWSET
ncbi:hypothetical protein [Bergeriella denitrificans]|uniref:Uncharacterized protein n=1 Tax=Bergeriella denitrificans TaxID=494 RepID=A0A378UJ10_BERDE|nr:hypothetical protein [Bergeriella denitrificans]STZ77374.1 Uncharacterised protein [Bergeriella denitrificans]